MQVYLTAAPEDVREAARHNRPLCHAASRIGTDSALLRGNLLLEARGGLMALSDRDVPPVERPEALCGAILRECGRRGYTGILLDFEHSPRPDLTALVRALGKQAGRRKLYLPESYGAAAPGACVLISTAVSGGSLAQCLREAADRWGGYQHLALDVQRLRMDFTLPAPSGQGTPLSAEEFQALWDRENPSVFFSQDLCARYFTYTQRGSVHFVLFDDADTLSRKVRLGAGAGIGTAFFLWPEIRDLAGRLFSGG